MEELQFMNAVKERWLLNTVTLLSSICKWRNCVIFNNNSFSPFRSARSKLRAWVEWKAMLKNSLHDNSFHHYMQHSSTTIPSFHRIKWLPPPHGVINVDFDSSKTNQEATTSYFLQDCTGRCLSAGAFNLGDTTILVVAEATTMRAWILMAIQAGSQGIIVEEDDVIVIQAVRGEIKVPIKIYTLVRSGHLVSTTTVTVVFSSTYFPWRK